MRCRVLRLFVTTAPITTATTAQLVRVGRIRVAIAVVTAGRVPGHAGSIVVTVGLVAAATASLRMMRPTAIVAWIIVTVVMA